MDDISLQQFTGMERATHVRVDLPIGAYSPRRFPGAVGATKFNGAPHSR
jgi:hypothetical protein